MQEYESLNHTKWECKYHVISTAKTTFSQGNLSVLLALVGKMLPLSVKLRGKKRAGGQKLELFRLFERIDAERCRCLGSATGSTAAAGFRSLDAELSGELLGRPCEI